MPEVITRPSPIIVQAVQRDGQPQYRHLWMPLSILTDEQGRVLRTPKGAIRYSWGKIFGPRVEKRRVDGREVEVEVPGQQFEYVGDPLGLENDPHLEVISDPDGLVEKAIAARDERAAQEAEKADKKAGRRRSAPAAT